MVDFRKWLFVFLSIAVLCAQSLPTGFFTGPTPSRQWWIKPGPIPASPTDLIAQDVWVCEFDVNSAAGGVTTINDKQGSPVPFWPGVVVPGSTSWTNILNQTPATGCRYFPGGIRWSSTGTVNAHMSGYVR